MSLGRTPRAFGLGGALTRKWGKAEAEADNAGIRRTHPSEVSSDVYIPTVRDQKHDPLRLELTFVYSHAEAP